MVMSSCAVQKKYNPAQKFAPQQLKEDFSIFRSMLEESHPSLYWYTSKDSMDRYFGIAENKLTDSLTENGFRYVLSYVTSKIRCGHTSTMPSKAAVKYAEALRSPALPFGIKAWPDTVLITSNLNRRDSVLARGSQLLAIAGRPVQLLVDSFFSHLSTDGYNLTHKYQSLSNGAVFRNFYAGLYGLRNKLQVSYTDSTGIEKQGVITAYNPAADTPLRRPPLPRISKRERKRLALLSERNMRIDTTLNTAFMVVNTFSKGKKLRSFFRRSFKEIRKKGVQNLVVDLRGNGGGSVTLSNLLTKYIVDKPFKIADSLYAIRSNSTYKKYRSQYFLNRLFFIFLTQRKKDGNWHFSLYEGKYFKPKKKNHFEGQTYLLTGGNTFSAATLFAKALAPQEDVTIVGEETGGGAYGNTAWLIPEVTLPNTKLRFRLPLFRLVIDKDAEKGRGLMPEVESLPTARDIRRGADFKMEKVIELIQKNASSADNENRN
jgi:hypothetical protein